MIWHAWLRMQARCSMAGVSWRALFVNRKASGISTESNASVIVLHRFDKFAGTNLGCAKHRSWNDYAQGSAYQSRHVHQLILRRSLNWQKYWPPKPGDVGSTPTRRARYKCSGSSNVLVCSLTGKAPGC